MASPVVTRPEWGAPGFAATPIGRVSQVFIHHSVTNAYADLVATMQGLEAHARALGHKAIDYSFCHFVGGQRAEGRGWFAQGGHTLNHNSDSYGLCAIGNFTVDPITDELLDALAATITEGIYLGAITSSPAVRPHSDVFATACPGALKEAIPDIVARIGQPDTPAAPQPTRKEHPPMVVYICTSGSLNNKRYAHDAPILYPITAKQAADYIAAGATGVDVTTEQMRAVLRQRSVFERIFQKV